MEWLAGLCVHCCSAKIKAAGKDGPGFSFGMGMFLAVELNVSFLDSYVLATFKESPKLITNLLTQ